MRKQFVIVALVALVAAAALYFSMSANSDMTLNLKKDHKAKKTLAVRSHKFSFSAAIYSASVTAAITYCKTSNDQCTGNSACATKLTEFQTCLKNWIAPAADNSAVAVTVATTYSANQTNSTGYTIADVKGSLFKRPVLACNNVNAVSGAAYNQLWGNVLNCYNGVLVSSSVLTAAFALFVAALSFILF